MSPSSSTPESRVHEPPRFDWASGRIHFLLPAEGRGGPEWSLVACGDWMPRSDYLTLLGQDPAGIYGDLVSVLRQADLSIVNLECPFVDADVDPIVKDGPVLRLPTSAIAGLTTVPFHLACLANNHMLDYGVQGVVATQDLLERSQVQWVGAGASAEEAQQARTFPVGGVRIAIVNVAEGEEACSRTGGPGAAPLDLPRIWVQLPALRSDGDVDVIVVVVHAGREHLPVPAPYVRTIYRSIVDAGADLVIGHHPHMPQGIEVYRGSPIVYSLGNFAFPVASSARYHRMGYVVRALFSGPVLGALEIWPYHIGQRGLSLMKGEALTSFCREMEDLSALIIDDGLLQDVWHAYADRWLLLHGVQELADSVALIGGDAVMLEAILKGALGGSARGPNGTGNGLLGRIARRAVWQCVHWLDARSAVRRRLSDPEKSFQVQRGASVLRNRIDTLAHRELYLTGLQRVIAGEVGGAPPWATERLVDWEVLQEMGS